MLLSKLTRCSWEVIVFRAAALSLVLILVLVSFARSTRGQENESQPPSEQQSLGDGHKLPKSKGGAGGGSGGGGKLSPDKQAYCDEVRQRKGPDAEQVCTV